MSAFSWDLAVEIAALVAFFMFLTFGVSLAHQGVKTTSERIGQILAGFAFAFAGSAWAYSILYGLLHGSIILNDINLEFQFTLILVKIATSAIVTWYLSTMGEKTLAKISFAAMGLSFINLLLHLTNNAL